MTERELKEGDRVLYAKFAAVGNLRSKPEAPRPGRIVRLTKTQFRVELSGGGVVGPFRRKPGGLAASLPFYRGRDERFGGRVWLAEHAEAVKEQYEEQVRRFAEKDTERREREEKAAAEREQKLAAAKERLGGDLESVVEWDCKSTYPPDEIEPEGRSIRRLLLHLPNDVAVLVSLEYRRQPNFRTGEWEDRVLANYSYQGPRGRGASGSGYDGPNEESVLWELVADLLVHQHI